MLPILFLFCFVFLSVKIHSNLLFEISWLSPFSTYLDCVFHLSLLFKFSLNFYFTGRSFSQMWGSHLKGNSGCFILTPHVAQTASIFFNFTKGPLRSSRIRSDKILYSFWCCCQISWSYFLGIPVQCFALSFEDPSDIPWLPSVFSCPGTDAM